MINVALNPLDAVENALNLFGDAVLRLAYSYLKKKEDAEDIVQDTLIRLMQSGEIFESEEHMKSWMLRVAANLCKDQLKSSKQQKEVALPGGGYEKGVEDEYISGENNAVIEAVMSLPEKYRSVIHLYYFEEYATKEIAEIVGKKESTVRSLLKRGREKLEVILSENMMKGDCDYEKGI